MAAQDPRAQLSRRDTWLAALAVVLTLIFQSTWYIAPEILSYPLWEGATLNLGFLLGSISLVVPVAIAWWCMHDDKPASSDDIHETSHH